MLTKFPFARIPIFMALCLFFKLRFPFSTMNPSRNRAFTCFLTPHSKTVFILTFSLEKPKKKSSQVVCERHSKHVFENCRLHSVLCCCLDESRIKQTAPCNIPILPVQREGGQDSHLLEFPFSTHLFVFCFGIIFPFARIPICSKMYCISHRWTGIYKLALSCELDSNPN